MYGRLLVVLACFVAMPGIAAAQGTLQAATAALGTTAIRTLQFTATGRAYVLGQPGTAADPWPLRNIKSYQASIDYGSGAMRVEQVLTMPSPAPRGGGGAFAGEQRQIQLVRGAYAWNEPPAPAGGGAAPPPQPQPAASVERVLWMWASTPQGALKAASGSTSTRSVAGGTELAFTLAARYPVVALINKMNQVEKVEARLPNDVLGDMPFVVTYSGYRSIGGVTFPSRIMVSQGGHPTLDLVISGVETNTFVDIEVPDSVRNAPPAAAVTATSQKVADGVFWITGGSHHSLAVDLGDHIAVVEGPQNEARSEVVIAETKKVIPQKPIRFIVNTHLHFDHSGGLRTFVDEGATVVTHQANRAFYEKAWAAPRTVSPDRLAKSKKTAMFQEVVGTSELKGTNGRVVELHVLAGNPHNEQTLVAWLPAEGILFQSDMMNPPAPNAQVPPPTPTVSNFYDTLQRLKIAPKQIVGGHGNRIATMDDLNRVAGRSGTN